MRFAVSDLRAAVLRLWFCVAGQACVWTPEEAIKSCQQIGYPVMLKASWGGGGKGIRKVHSDEEVLQVFKQIQGEVRRTTEGLQ